MNVSKIENLVVVQTWQDVATVLELQQKYGLSGSEYIETPFGVFPGCVDDGSGVYVSPPPKSVDVVEWRETAILTKQELCLALREESVLNDADTKIAVNGGWPAPFLPALALINDPVKAEIIWSGATVINRNDPLILLLQSYSLTDPAVIDLTDTLVDSMFGLAP